MCAYVYTCVWNMVYMCELVDEHLCVCEYGDGGRRVLHHDYMTTQKMALMGCCSLVDSENQWEF